MGRWFKNLNFWDARMAGCLQIGWRDACKSGKKSARGVPSPRIWRVCSFHRRRSLPGSIMALCSDPLFYRGAFDPSADGRRGFALRCVLPQGRSPHPQTDAAALRCAALSTGAFTPSADGCRDFALRSVLPHRKHFLGRCSARRGDADDVVHKIERLQRALDRGGAAHDVGEHDGAILQLDGADVFHDRFLLIAGNADNR